jgi:hypothetical protein
LAAFKRRGIARVQAMDAYSLTLSVEVRETIIESSQIMSSPECST